MRFHSALISSFLFAFAVLAEDSEFIGAGVTLISENNATFRTIEGGMKTQMVSGNVGDSVTAFATLDPVGCSHSVFVGVTCSVVQAPSETLCRVWVDYKPGLGTDFPDFSIDIGDTIIFGVTAPYYNKDDPSNAHSLRVYAQKENNSSQFTDTTIDNYQPCGQQAGWAVGNTPDLANPGYHLPIARFGRLVMPSTLAYGPQGDTYSPSDDTMAKPYEMIYPNGSITAVLQAESNSIIVTDIRPADWS